MKKKIPSLVGIIFIIGCAFLIGSIVWQYSLFLEISSEQVIAGKRPASECDDHIDNDGDGYCDYAWKKAYCNDGSIVGDAGCRSKRDNNESNCGDGICEGSESYANCNLDCPCVPSSEICNNVDDDCNGFWGLGR